MEDQDCHPSIWKRCHWHPEAAGALDEALAGMWPCCSICNLTAAAV